MELYSNLLYFLLFAVVAAGIFGLAPKKYKSLVLLCINIIFYSVCAGWYVVFMIGTGFWSYYCAQRIGNIQEDKRKKKWLTLGIVPLVLLLCFFKYWTPAQSIIGEMINQANSFNVLKIILPLGMSYYILKSISYMIDVYKHKLERNSNLWDYLAYVSFFGQIVSGPIQRFGQWEQELHREKPIKTWQNGFYLILLGLFMKLVIANRLADFVNVTFASPETANGLTLWLCFFLYAVYIYCDFAGYSYIAVGVTNFMGIDCIDNFNRPYFSKDIREFWNRWHISLSSWLRDYIYIPLGGNRKGPVRRVINVLITFLVCGVWHGSTMSFVVWGGYHGVVNALTKKKPKGEEDSRFVGAVKTIWTFILVSIGWVFFASPTLGDAVEFFNGMLTRMTININTMSETLLAFKANNTSFAFLLTALIFILIFLLKEANDVYKFIPSKKSFSFIWQVFLLSSVLLFGVFGTTSFIYAGF